MKQKDYYQLVMIVATISIMPEIGRAAVALWAGALALYFLSQDKSA